MSVEQFETEVLELAVRKVRTPEGSQKYGLPIGAIITADAIEAAKANGFTEAVPEDKPGFKAGYKAAKGKFMKGTISGKAEQEKSAPKPQAEKPLGLKVQKSKLTGNKHFKVGESKYVAPNGSKLIRPADKEGLAYVVTPDGKVHAFNEQGEIPLPKPLDTILAQKFGDGFEGDDEYSIEEFEASSASHSLPDQKIGSILTDAEGTPQFKKLADDSWEHVDLGVKLKDQDLQDLYDSGDLIPDATDDDNNAAEGAFQDTEAMNFAEMSKEEAETALANLPEGQKLTVGDSKWTKTGPDTFTNDEGKGGTVKSLAVVKAAIKIGQDPEPEYNPLDAETKDPLDANPPKLVGDQPDDAWIKGALPGAQMDFESAAGVTTTWTKDEEGTGWTNQKGGKLSQEALLNAHKNTGGEGLSIKKEGKEPKAPAGEKTAVEAPAAETASTPKPKAEKKERDWSTATPDELDEGLQTGKISLKKYKEIQAEQNGFKSQSTPPLSPEVMYSDSMEPLDVTAENGFVPGDYDFTTEATEDDIKNAQPGDKFLLGFSDLSAEDDGDFNVWDADSVVEKQPDGTWKNLTYPDSGDVNQEDLELEASAQGYEEQEKQIWAFKGNKPASEAPAKTGPQFGDADYFDNAEDGEVVWFKGKPYEMDATGGWWGEAGVLGSGEMKKYYAEGQISAEEKPYTPNLRDLGPHSNKAETLEILKHAAVGDTVHPVNSNATLTKVNSDADQIIDHFGTEGDEGGYWQSSVTGKFLKGSELAQIWSGDLMAGPSNGDMGDTPTPEPVVEEPTPEEKTAFQSITEKIQDIDQANSVQEMATWLSAANPGEKVTALISNATYEKTPKGTFKTKNAPGVELTPQEMASFHWNTEMQISELAYGDLTPKQVEERPKTFGQEGYFENPAEGDVMYIDGSNEPAVFTNGEWTITDENGPMTYTPGEMQEWYDDGTVSDKPFLSQQPEGEKQLPDGIPAGSTEVGELADVPVGTTMWEHHPQNGIYTHKKVGEDELETTTESGFKIPGNTYADVQEMVADPDWKGTFYQPPAPLPAGLPADAVEFDSNYNNFDADTQSLYGVQTHADNPDVYEFVPTEADEYLTYGPGEDGSLTSHYDVQDMMDQGSHTFYVGSPTKFAKKDGEASAETESLGWVAGDILDTPEAFDQVPVGTKLAYQQKSGKISYYSTLGNGMVLTPGGNQMPVTKMSWAIGQGNVSIHELPEGAVAPAAPGAPSDPDQPVSYLFMDGDPIQAMDQLASLNIGQKLEMQDGEGNHLNYVVKNDKGEWIVPDDAPKWQGLIFSNGDMADAMSKGGVYFVGTPGVSGHTTVPNTVAAPEEKAPLLPGVTVLQGEAQAALDGLLAHSSFHVKYGLKDLPASNPLTNPQTQEDLKVLAMEKYPELKAKPAVVQYLKDYLGVKDPEPNWEDALMEAAPKITLGSKTPKKVGVQGMDGGEYTATEIQDAINILEAYPGKLFKSELAKKGNPLGELDPTQLVGFDKDKLVTKQKYIDLLKTKLVNQEAQPKQPLIQSFEEFESYPVGTQVAHHTSLDGSVVDSYTKISETQWLVDMSSDKTVIDNAAFKGSIEKGNLRLHKLPDVVPEYAKTPAAVKDKEKEQHDTDADDFSLATMQNADLGTKMHWGDGNSNVAEKTADNEWTIWDADGNKINSWPDEKFYDNIKNYGGWTFSDVSEDTPNFNANAPMAIIPGKYSAEGAKAFMVVHADGSGTYYPTKGDGVKLSPEKVKSNYTAGMSQYHGLVKESDLPAAPAAKKPAAKKPKVVGDIADGTYFAGNPNDPKAAVYEVSGGTAKIFKPATGLTATTGVKIGGQPTAQWADEAGFGATVDAQNMNVLGVWIGSTKWVKGKDGKWTGTKLSDGELVGEPQDYPPTGWGKKVSSHGMSSPVELPKAKVNTLFSQGQLSDQYGNAVLPDGYTGSAMFLGAKTTVPALLAAQKWMDSQEFTDTITDSGKLQEGLKALGVNFDVHNWQKWRKANGLTEAGFEGSKDAMKKVLADVTTGVDTDIPEADTTSLFQWNNLGQPVMPLELASKPVVYGKVGKGEWIKEASQHIGGGKVIGLHLAKMDDYDRTNWINAFKAGDFAKLYQLEVAAAALEGKAHGSGYLHPGFPDNDTKKISWAAAVEGEISALEDIPGEWTSTSLNPPADEVNNYLIKAQMQNPTYLTQAERRQWYSAHRNSNKDQVDQLSATAALRKKQGEAELTAPLTWTDNIKPAKSYDTLFEADDLPVLNWTSSKGLDYVNDNPDNAELQSMFEAKKNEGYGEMGAANSAVSAYFQAQKDANEAELAKVFYQKTPNQKVKKGTHPIYEYDDFNGHGPLGGHYFFKPSPQGDAYRSEAEHLGHEYGWVFGFKTAGSQLIELDGKYGQLQKDLGSKSSLAQFDLSTLNANQIADIGREHILDWFLDNDDTHSENMQMLPDGSLVGIDKGRAFKHFGKWQGLNPSAMNSNAQTIYSKLFQTIQSGKLSKEDVDKAYLQIQKRAQQMAKVDDQKIADMLATGMAKRKIWDVSYKVDGKAVPNNLQGLTAAVLDRKNKLPEQIEQMWKDIYAKAGFGDLPEPPPYKLGEEHYSGLDEVHFHENAFNVGAGGVSTLMAGDFSQTGAAIAWNTVNKDGSKELYTQVELNHVADGAVYSKLQAMNPDATDGSADPTTFDKDEYGGFFSRDYYRTMATLAKHNDDKAYNADRIAEYQTAKVRLAKDLDAIQGQTLPVPNKEGLVKMPSGALVPQQQLGQYRMMLEFYQGKEAAMDATIATQADFPASAKAKFEPYPLKVKGKNYANTGMDAQLTELANGDFIYSDPSGAKTVSKDAVPDMIAAVGGWQELAGEPEGPKSFGGATVQLVNTTFETKGTWDADTGQIGTGTGSVGSWTKGSEFKITLPTGETIYFRNRAKTNTLHSQYGRMTIKVPNASSPSDYAAGIERAQDWLASYLDLDMSGADEESAELIYWKQMLPTLTRRTHKSGSKYQKAFQAVEAKAKELGVSTDDFPFKLNDFMTREQQIAFYRKIWGDQFGMDKIDKLVSEQGFMPTYEATDIHTKDVTQGRPIWKRFDIDLAELLKSNPKAFVASHNTSGQDAKKSVATSGVHLSTEERIRFFGGVAGGSSSSDQQMGTGGQDQFTRIWDNPSSTGFDYVYHPSTLLHTNTRFFHNDAFGAESSEKSSANPDPMDWWKNKTSNSGSLGGGNQLDIRWSSGWMNSLEMVVFDSIADRDYAIQKLKQAGLEMIRGLPVEDRLVMRQNTKEAIEKLRKQWLKEAGL